MNHRSICPVLILASVFLLPAAESYAVTGPARLLKDINPTPSSNRGSYPDHYQRLGNFAFFQASTPQTGMELWRTDGTQARTFLVKDINPGPSGAFNYPGFYDPDVPFAELGGSLLFLADDGIHGFELWRTDGTEAGTGMVKEIRPGTGSPFDADRGPDRILHWEHIEIGGTMYFLADDGVRGFELWRTDGTDAGTFLLNDITPGSRGGFGTYIFPLPLLGTQVGGSFFFRARDDVDGDELWKTDGTPAGTVQVKDIYPGQSGSYPANLIPLNGILLFAANDGENGQELWKSDGTQAGTVLVKDLVPWPGSSYPHNLIRVNDTVFFAGSNRLYRTDGSSDGTVPLREFASEVFPMREWNGSLLFLADDGAHGRELWKSDGTQAGTVLVKDINPGQGDSSHIFGVTEAAGRLLFFADDGVHGAELWASDGTEGGTALVKDLTPGPTATAMTGAIGVDGSLFFMVEVGYNLVELWKSDGTEAGTRLVLGPLPYLWPGVGLHGSLLFSADDGTHGYELWKSDGSSAGTVLVKDVNPSFVTNWSDTQFMGAVSVPGIGERMFFSADDGVHGPELWVSDGTEQGTRLVKDIFPGDFGSWPTGGIAHDGALFFAAGDPVYGQELWKSDGTEAGTVLVADIFPGPYGSMQYDGIFVELNGSLFFGADDGVHGRTLWKSDGTGAGTVQVANINLSFSFFSGSGNFRYPIAIDGTLYFGAADPAHGLELWKSDGTEVGTVLVKDIAPGPASSGPRAFAELNGKLFMAASDPVHRYEPWLSDGTEAGTLLIKDVFPGSGSSLSSQLPPQKLGGSIYYAAVVNSQGRRELWKTDGTEAGTVLVKDFHPGKPFARIDDPTVFNGTLFCLAGLASDTNELWKSDGTEQGTMAVKTGPGSMANLQAVDGGLLFAALDIDHGFELWRSDGTEDGTVLAQDILPGPDGSYPGEFTAVGDRLFFMAYDDIAGGEPWVARTAILLNQPGRAVQDLKSEVQALHLARGMEIGLTTKLDTAAKALSANQTTQAILSLEGFIKHVDVLTPRRISEASAVDLKVFAQDLVNLLQGASNKTLHTPDAGDGAPVWPRGRPAR